MLHAIVGTSPIIAVGDRGTALRFDPAERRWVAEQTGVFVDLHAASASVGQIFAAGAHGTVLHRTADGRWSVVESGVTADLHGVVVSTTDFSVTAVGDRGTIVTAGTTGIPFHAQASPTTANLRAVAEWNGTLLAVGDGGAAITTADRSPWTLVSTGTTVDLYFVGTAEIPYEERRASSSGFGSNTGFIAAGAGGAVLVERLGSTPGWRPVRAGGAAIRAMTADPWTFFTEGGTSIEFSAR